MSDEKVKQLIHSTGLKNNLQDHIVNKIINSQYKFVRKTISELEIPSDVTEEEFDKLKTNFIFRGLGKIYTSYRTFETIKKQRDYKRNNKNNKVDGEQAD